jgi:hypothetical protein
MSGHVTESVSHWPYLPALILIAGPATGEGRAVARIGPSAIATAFLPVGLVRGLSDPAIALEAS